MMTCDEMKDLIPLYVGGEVEENERIAVDAHVGMCSDCAHELEEFRQSRGLLESLREEETPPGTSSRIWKRVKEELFPRKRAVAFGDWALKCAAVLVIGVAIGYAAFTAFRRPEPVAQTPQSPALSVETRGGMIHGPARTAGSGGGGEFFQENPREKRVYVMPRTSRAGGSHYLPRVETILTGGDRDF